MFNISRFMKFNTALLLATVILLLSVPGNSSGAGPPTVPEKRASANPWVEYGTGNPLRLSTGLAGTQMPAMAEGRLSQEPLTVGPCFDTGGPASVTATHSIPHVPSWGQVWLVTKFCMSGCVLTSVAMMLDYWDKIAYDNLMPNQDWWNAGPALWDKLGIYCDSWVGTHTLSTPKAPGIIDYADDRGYEFSLIFEGNLKGRNDQGIDYDYFDRYMELIDANYPAIVSFKWPGSDEWHTTTAVAYSSVPGELYLIVHPNWFAPFSSVDPCYLRASDFPHSYTDSQGDTRTQSMKMTVVGPAEVDIATGDYWLDNYGYGPDAGWWRDENPRMMADVDNDGDDDVVGFGNEGVSVAYSTGFGFITSSGPLIDDFDIGRGWEVNKHPRMMADVDGDDMADVVGFFDDGVYVSLSDSTPDNPSFLPPELWVAQFGYDQDWRVEKHPRMMADVNGDGMADVVGFGNGGVWVSTSTGSGFNLPQLWFPHYDYDHWWRVDQHPRMMADVDGDGDDDVVGFGQGGVWVALADPDNARFLSSRWVDEYAYDNDKGWRVQKHPRMMADVNGDDRADVVAFGDDGVWVSLSGPTPPTPHFEAPQLWFPHYGYNQGWRVEKHPRMMADVNGDDRADVVGFSDAAVWVALADPDNARFLSRLWVTNYGYFHGWEVGKAPHEYWKVEKHPRMMADVNGVGGLDIVGFGERGIYVWPSWLHLLPPISVSPNIVNSDNHPPNVAVDNSSVIADEGQMAINSGTFGDSDGDPVTLSVPVGTVVKTGDNTWFWSFTTSDGPAESHVVSIFAADDTDAQEIATFDLTVNNVAPTAHLNDPPTIGLEGSLVSLVGSATDPAETYDELSFAWAVAKNGASFTTGSEPTLDFTPDDNDSYEATLTVSDKDGGSDSISHIVTVENVPPTLILDVPATGTEGEMVTVVGTASDPALIDEETMSYSYSVTKDGIDYLSGDSYLIDLIPDDNGEYLVTMTAIDKDGGSSGPVSHIVDVGNVAPTVGPINGPSTVIVGTEITVDASFTDPGLLDTHTAIWDWDDGTTDPASLTQGTGSGSVSNSHTYLASGNYNVELIVTDNDGGAGSAGHTVMVQSPPQATGTLIEMVEAIEELPEGIENELTSKLDNALKDLEKGNNNAAMGKLGAFINSVEAQRGKKISEADADALIQIAQHIIDAINNGLS